MDGLLRNCATGCRVDEAFTMDDLVDSISADTSGLRCVHAQLRIVFITPVGSGSRLETILADDTHTQTWSTGGSTETQETEGRVHTSSKAREQKHAHQRTFGFTEVVGSAAQVTGLYEINNVPKEVCFSL
ncbi:hypothetical protein DPX16_12824 [Anabarilius grahami]|uniref:Uncharacterized protein n=1 Tax=Anabarilius grahami TaxID=495550 RepID=A0A3N0XCZ7_ANAGA|nr:hypothetical protein DPX16_12824 [Anabarilius grahami]